MTEKLKYKVGDRILFEAIISEVDVDDTDAPYYLNFKDDDTGLWVDEEELDALSDNLPPKPKVTQAVMEYYTQNISADYDYDEWFERNGMPDGIASWLYYDSDDDILMQRQHALATLIAYGPEAVEVEKEKRYKVTLKSNGQILVKVRLAGDKVSCDFMYSDVTEPYYTKQELIDAGFEGVFDNPMFEVEEVE